MIRHEFTAYKKENTYPLDFTISEIQKFKWSNIIEDFTLRMPTWLAACQAAVTTRRKAERLTR